MKAIIVFVLGLIASSYSEVNVVVDLSHWNGNINLRTAKTNGLTAVIHKASQGLTYSDPQYSTRKSLAEKEGILWGAYHFGVGGKSGTQQANNFLRTVGDTSKVLLALDIEENKNGKDMSVTEAEDFVKTVKEKTGRYPLIYGSSSFLEKYNTPTLKKCNLWIAHYTNRASPALPSGWSSWVLWQYTDGRIGGSPRLLTGVGLVDRDRKSVV